MLAKDHIKQAFRRDPETGASHKVGVWVVNPDDEESDTIVISQEEAEFLLTTDAYYE